MFDMSILGQVAPILLILGASPLLYRVYLKMWRRLHGLTTFALALTQVIFGVLCVIGAFFATPYFGALTAGLLILIGATDIIIIVTWGGKAPIAALVALGVGVWFGYSGSAAAQYKISLFFELIGKNVPELYIAVGLGLVIAMVIYIFLRMFQDLLVAFASLLDTSVITVLIVGFCLAQGLLLISGSSLQPLLQELINRT